jgi:hypothetical protein
LIKHNAFVKKLYKRCALIWMVHSSFFLNISWLLLFCVIQASHRNDSVASRFDLLYVEEFFILQHSVVANENSSPLELQCLLLIVLPLSIFLWFLFVNSSRLGLLFLLDAMKLHMIFTYSVADKTIGMSLFFVSSLLLGTSFSGAHLSLRSWPCLDISLTHRTDSFCCFILGEASADG